MTDVYTMNLSENSGTVWLTSIITKSTNFIANTESDSGPSQVPQTTTAFSNSSKCRVLWLEKNVSENKQTMDSTSISDIMGQPEAPLEPPMMAQDPRMTQMQMQTPMMQAQAASNNRNSK